jgi:hypothetical protein
MRKAPKGYIGENHETLGSDILSISNALSMTEQVLGKDMAARITAVKPDQWYPVALMLDALEVVERKVGGSVLRQVGRRLFELSHAEQAKAHVKSAADLIFSINTMYTTANRGVGIGGWVVRSFEPGRAVLEKSSPHPCMLEEGILTQAFVTCGFPVLVKQTQCVLKGDECCLFELSSVLQDVRWHGGRAPIPAAKEA